MGIKEVMLLGVLGIQALWDIRCKEIPTGITLFGAGVGILFLLDGHRSITNLFLSLIPGFVLLLIGKLSQEAVGYGDGCMVMMLGIYEEVQILWEVCMAAFFTATLVGLGLLVFGKKRGKEQIPFIPFLLLGYVCVLLL